MTSRPVLPIFVYCMMLTLHVAIMQEAYTVEIVNLTATRQIQFIDAYGSLGDYGVPQSREWHIEKGGDLIDQIDVVLQSYNVEYSYGCLYGRLEITAIGDLFYYSSDRGERRELMYLCGKTNYIWNRVYTTTSTLAIKFTTTFYTNETGFRLHFYRRTVANGLMSTTLPNNLQEIERATVELRNRESITLYATAQEKTLDVLDIFETFDAPQTREWVIIMASNETHIVDAMTITLQAYMMDYSFGCMDDVLELKVEEPILKGHLMYVCGNSSTLHKVHVGREEVIVTFRKANNKAMKGFRLTYIHERCTSQCSGFDHAGAIERATVELRNRESVFLNAEAHEKTLDASHIFENETFGIPQHREWRITKGWPIYDVLTIKLQAYVMDYSFGCLYDALEISIEDDTTTQHLAYVCGSSSAVHQVLTTKNQVTIKFRTTNNQAVKGFRLTYSQAGCDSQCQEYNNDEAIQSATVEIRNREMTILDPQIQDTTQEAPSTTIETISATSTVQTIDTYNTLGDYGVPQSKEWHIEKGGIDSDQLDIILQDYNTEYSFGCLYGHLEIAAIGELFHYIKDVGGRRELVYGCGKSINRYEIFTTTSRLAIRFNTYSNTNQTGFRLSFSRRETDLTSTTSPSNIQEIERATMELRNREMVMLKATAQEKTLEAFNISETYGVPENREWRITHETGNSAIFTIQVQAYAMDYSFGCLNDVLEVKVEEPHLNVHMVYVCGNSTTVHKVLATTSQVIVRYRTTDNKAFKGFRLTYSMVGECDSACRGYNNEEAIRNATVELRNRDSMTTTTSAM